MALCSTMIDTAGPVAFACELDSGHPGPHMAKENARSVRERKAWESAQTLNEFQGKAETTAERYTANPTPPPSVCERCWAGEHLECVQRVQIIAVAYHGHERVEKVCGCFEQSPRDHGINMEELNQPTKQRVGDQILPPVVSDDEPSVQDRLVDKIHKAKEQGLIDGEDEDIARVIEAIQASKERGKRRYGTYLHTFNDRDILQDIIEEAMDLLVYMSSMQDARDATRQKVITEVVEAMDRHLRAAPDSKVTVRLVAEVAVDTIFKAMGGPVTE